MTASDPRVGEIEARLNAASIHDGPWAVEEDETWGAKVYVREPGFGTMYICENLNQQEDGLADAEFIANAPADVRYLLAELRGAREALGRVEGLADAFVKRGEHLIEFAKTAPEDVTESLTESGGDFLHKGRLIRAAVAAADGGGREV